MPNALRSFFADHDRMDRAAAPLRLAAASDSSNTAESDGDGALPRAAISAITSYWRKSPAAAWASSTKHGKCRSTAPSRSR